jgi:hypothetical protein
LGLLCFSTAEAVQFSTAVGTEPESQKQGTETKEKKTMKQQQLIATT